MRTTSDISVQLVDFSGSDLSVVNAARVSFNKSTQEMTEKDIKLVYYLAKHKHTSPFNHAFLSFRVQAPIFVARQLVKHKFLPWNEVSRRYVDDPPVFYFPEKWRKRAENVKQGSSDEAYEFPPGQFEEIMNAYARLNFSYLHSHEACPEQLRMILPQNMMTEWIWSGTLGAFCDMLKLRLKPDTQEETRKVAQLIATNVKTIFPVSYDALLKDYS